MTFIVEDGTGLPDANSYASVADADEHYTARGDAEWLAATEAEKEYALIKATDYLDAVYVFRSVPLTETQSLECPRYGQLGLHQRLVKACLILAKKALTTELDTVPSLPVIEQTTELDGVAKESTKWAAGKVQTDPHPMVTKLLNYIATVRGGSGSVMAVRHYV